MASTVLLTIILLWIVGLTYVLLPQNTVSGVLDKLTKGNLRKDKENLALMLQHLQNFPEEWSISTSGAAFPLEGRAKKISINIDKSGKVEYALGADDYRPLLGYYKSEFNNTISNINNNREREELMRNLYPEMGQLLLK